MSNTTASKIISSLTIIRYLLNIHTLDKDIWPRFKIQGESLTKIILSLSLSTTSADHLATSMTADRFSHLLFQTEVECRHWVSNPGYLQSGALTHWSSRTNWTFLLIYFFIFDSGWSVNMTSGTFSAPVRTETTWTTSPTSLGRWTPRGTTVTSSVYLARWVQW